MPNENIQDQNDNIEIDDWSKAFAALEGTGQENDPQPEQEQGDATQGDNTPENTGSQAEPEDQGTPAAGDGGLVPETDVAGIANALEDAGATGFSQAELDQVIKDTQATARERAIKEMADIFIKNGERNSNGRLGASLDDPDICKRDRDGVPTYYNPETGRPFTSDDPRRQAREWVESYNRELADKFNRACAERESAILKESEPRLNTLRFQPTYEKLDPIRQGMLDDIISDYEVKDSEGDVIGYSCDLNRALDVVNKQIARIQNYAKSQPRPATGPTYDMKTSSGANAGVPPKTSFSSLEEAMEYQQNQMLEKLKK